MSATDDRFSGLTKGQRNRIYHALTAEENSGQWPWVTHDLSRKYGVSEQTIRDVYLHVWRKRRDQVLRVIR